MDFAFVTASTLMETLQGEKRLCRAGLTTLLAAGVDLVLV